MTTTPPPPGEHLPPTAPAPGQQPGAAGPGGQPGLPPRRNGAAKPVAIVAIVIGALVLLGTLGSATVSAVAAATRTSSSQSIDAGGVTSLDVDASATTFTIVYGPGDEATLEVSDRSRGEWTLARTGDRLLVSSPSSFFGWWWFDEGDTAVLTLPEDLRDSGLDADLSLAAGDLRAEGSFGELTLDLGAGGMRVEGSAETLDADISAGRADLELQNVSEASFSVSAGTLVGELTGTAPDSVSVEVSAGTLDVTLPDATYDVSSDVSAGSFDNRLDVAASSPRQVTVDVSAGGATLRMKN